jgi:hypothetical protein
MNVNMKLTLSNNAYMVLCGVSVSRVRWERTVGRSGGDRPQAGGIAQRGFVGFRGGLLMARPMAHNDV